MAFIISGAGDGLPDISSSPLCGGPLFGSRQHVVGVRSLDKDDGLVNGLNEVCKAVDRKEALICVLAEDCSDPKYAKLVTALAKANNVPLIQVEKRDELGEWLGHCKYDKEGNARKVKGCSSLAIKNFGEDSEALSFVQKYIKDNKLGE
jgi:small subunit ribosomal protein S12e